MVSMWLDQYMKTWAIFFATASPIQRLHDSATHFVRFPGYVKEKDLTIMKHVAICTAEAKNHVDFADREITLKFKYNLYIYSNAEKEMWKSQKLKKMCKRKGTKKWEANVM